MNCSLLREIILRYYATSRKVAVTSPYEVIGFFFKLPNAFSCTMALTKVSTRNLPGGGGGDRGHNLKADNFAEICEPIVYKIRDPQHLTPYRSPRPVTGFGLSFYS
jgi:hypothetical protein